MAIQRSARSIPTCAACRRSGSPRAAMPVQRRPGSGRRTAAVGPSGRGPAVAGLGHGVVDHRHGDHPPLGLGPARALLAAPRWRRARRRRRSCPRRPCARPSPAPGRRSRPRPGGRRRRGRRPRSSARRSTRRARRPASLGRVVGGRLGEAGQAAGQADDLARPPGVSRRRPRAAASASPGARAGVAVRAVVVGPLAAGSPRAG